MIALGTSVIKNRQFTDTREEQNVSARDREKILANVIGVHNRLGKGSHMRHVDENLVHEIMKEISKLYK